MQIGPDYEERLKRVLEDRAKESVFADPLTFPRPKDPPRPRRLPPAPPLKPKRGVYEDDIVPPGERWFKVVTSSGKIGRIELPEELIDPSFEENLWRRLDARDPVHELRVV